MTFFLTFSLYSQNFILILLELYQNTRIASPYVVIVILVELNLLLFNDGLHSIDDDVDFGSF